MKHREIQHTNWRGIVIGVLSLGILGIGVYNLINPTYCGFFKASAINCVTLLVAVLVSFFLTQRENDTRKRKDIFANFIMKFRSEISASKMYELSKLNSSEIMMTIRDINNYIDIMDRTKNEFSIVSEVDFIQEKFKEYDEIVGNHINNVEEFQSLKNELRRPLRLIDSKLLEIALKLYT